VPKAAAVEAAEAVTRAGPEEAPRVAHDADDVVLGQAVGGRVPAHRQLLRRNGRGPQREEGRQGGPFDQVRWTHGAGPILDRRLRECKEGRRGAVTLTGIVKMTTGLPAGGDSNHA